MAPMNAREESALDDLRWSLRIVWPLLQNFAGQSVRKKFRSIKHCTDSGVLQRRMCRANVTGSPSWLHFEGLTEPFEIQRVIA
jgi:hypothetical protein